MWTNCLLFYRRQTITWTNIDLAHRRNRKIAKLRFTGLCKGNSPVTDEFPSQGASNAENASIWWRHHIDDHSIPWNRYEFPEAIKQLNGKGRLQTSKTGSYNFVHEFLILLNRHLSLINPYLAKCILEKYDFVYIITLHWQEANREFSGFSTGRVGIVYEILYHANIITFQCLAVCDYSYMFIQQICLNYGWSHGMDG